MAEVRETIQNSKAPHGCDEGVFNCEDFLAKLGLEGTSLFDDELIASGEPQLSRRASYRRMSRSVSIISDTGDIVEESESKEIERFTTILRKFFTRATPAAIYKDLRNRLDAWKNVNVNLGVIGASGTGKSTLINTLRRLKPEQPGAAEVDAVQTTIKPTPYSYTTNPCLKLWDLPGVGTPDFPKENYLRRIEFEKYDSFLIVCSTRFTENDIWFACELQRTGKHFHFVRTKVDIDIRNDREDHPSTHDQKKLLDKLRENCAQHLTTEKFGNLFVALVCKDPEAFDFPKLEEKMVFDLKNLQRDAVVFTLQTATLAVIKEKTAKLLKRVEFIRYAAGAAALLPGLSTLLSAGLICRELKQYKDVYGLNEERLKEIIVGKNLSEEDIDCVIGQNFWVDLRLRNVLNAMSNFVRESRENRPLWKEVVSVFRFAHSFKATPQFLSSSIASMESAVLIILDKFVLMASGRYRDSEFASTS